ncbi:DUF3307 domain-containing protein [Mycoplasmatota bacterium]|nr:DUF3307 domain-containing protein [Mycoplasmatota bacterium]
MTIGIGMLFFITHVLGDFYLCNQKLTIYSEIDKKNTSNKDIIIHSVIYQILFLILLIFFGVNIKFIITFLLIGISHYIVDTFLFFIQKIKSLPNTRIYRHLFFIKQTIPILIIFLCLWYLKSETISSHIALKIFVNDFYYIRLVFAFLLVGKPSNVVFKKIFTRFKPDSLSEITTDDKTYQKAGATIGTLERMLILICIINGLYSSIGLIFTAKSIARYNRISNEPAFSEYYLLGTLSSVLFTIIIYIISFTIF